MVPSWLALDRQRSSPFRFPVQIWMATSFCVGCGLAAAVLLTLGTGPKGTVGALQATARFSFLLFWLAYAGGALVTLFGPIFNSVARHARTFGLSFASAQTVHAALVIWLYWISPEPPVSRTILVFFGVALFWMYLLALFSIKRLSSMIGHRHGRTLRLVGSEYISFAFLTDFVGHSASAHPLVVLAYLPFLMMSVSGTLLRILAWISRRAKPAGQVLVG